MGQAGSHVRPIKDIPLPERQAVLDMKLTVDGIAGKIKSGAIRKIVCLTGAGLSTAAGLPDFRSDDGLYSQLDHYGLPSPESVFDIAFFRTNAFPFFHLSRELYPGTVLPTRAHYALALLANKGVLHRCFTQNIDTLERMAGVPEDKLVEAHGSFETASCVACGKPFDKEYVADHIFDGAVPRCSACAGIVKPNITFFGEALPRRFGMLSGSDAAAADLLIVMGTSLQVQPVASLPAQVSDTCPRLLINREAVFVAPESDEPGADAAWTEAMFPPSVGAGFRFNSPDNYRDVFLKGDCDDGMLMLMDALGWRDELDTLYETATAKLQAVVEANIKRKAAAKPFKAATESGVPGSDHADAGEEAQAEGGGAGAAAVVTATTTSTTTTSTGTSTSDLGGGGGDASGGGGSGVGGQHSDVTAFMAGGSPHHAAGVPAGFRVGDLAAADLADGAGDGAGAAATPPSSDASGDDGDGSGRL